MLESLSLLEDVHALATAGYLSPDAAAELVDGASQHESAVREKMVSKGTLSTHLERLDEAKERLSNFSPPAQSAVYAEMTSYEAEAYQRVFRQLVKAAPSVRLAKQMIENVLLEA